MSIPENYKVLFLQGGASQQFEMVPLNLLTKIIATTILTLDLGPKRRLKKPKSMAKFP